MRDPEIFLANLPMPLVRLLHFFLNTVTSLRKALFPAPILVLEIITGKWLAQSVAAACSLGIPALLNEQPTSARDIAIKLCVDPDYVGRLMDALSAHGIFKKKRDSRYALNRISKLLLPDRRSSFYGMAALTHEEPQWKAWGHLKEGITRGQSPFELANNASFFDFLTKNQSFADRFTDAMTGMAGLTRELINKAYKFPKTGVIVDIGGGSGSLLAYFLEIHPLLTGISFDLPEIEQTAKSFINSRDLQQRLQFEPGSFFDKAPQGGDFYILKNILHDWSNDECRAILKNVRNAMPPHAKLLVIEMVRDTFNGHNMVELFDMQMLVLTKGGKERSLSEFKTLLAEEQFRFVSLRPTLAALCIIEFEPA